jgi:hypothetical protein
VSVLDREQAMIQIGFTGNQFTENQVTLLAEMRGQLAVFNPEGVNVLSIPSNSP